MPLRTTKHWFGVVLDAPDASALAHFYQRLLGWTLYKDTPGWATLAPSESAGYNLSFQTEPHHVRPVWPSEPGKPIMMLHLDLEVDDLDAAVRMPSRSGPSSLSSSRRRTCVCCSTPPVTRSASMSTTPSDADFALRQPNRRCGQAWVGNVRNHVESNACSAYLLR